MRGDRDVIGAIYDTLPGPGGTFTLPALLGRILGSSSVVITVSDPVGGLSVDVHNIPRQAIEAGIAHYFMVNPLSKAADAVGDMRVARGEDVLPLSDYSRTEFYTDFAAPLDTVEVVGVKMLLGHGPRAEVCLHRERRVRRFDSRDVARMQRLLPHINRVLQLRQRLRPADDLGLAALDHAESATLILSAGGRIAFVNRAAEALVAAGHMALGGTAGLVLHRPDGQRQLAGLVVDAARGGSGGSMAAAAPGGRRLLLVVAPLAPRFQLAPGHVLVMVRLAEPRPAPPAKALQAMFGLTAAEARLAVALAGGATVNELTVAWNLSENTLRSQLSAVLGKAGVAGQRDLVALIAAVPVPFVPPRITGAE